MSRTLLRLILAAAAIAAVAAPVPAARAVALRSAHRVPASPWWIRRIDTEVAGSPVSVEVAYRGAPLYEHLDHVLRAPASNEKLLLSMALLDHVDGATTIPTRLLTPTPPVNGVISGNLWIEGHGDPEGSHATLAALAARLKATGVRAVRGSVLAESGPFARDWWANGWRPYFPRYDIPLPTALTYDGNVGPHGIDPPEPDRRAAVVLTAILKARGIAVKGAPGIGSPAAPLTRLAEVRSLPLATLIHHMDVPSDNFDAEVLGKYLGTHVLGPPGTIAKGATTIEAFAAANGVHDIVANDGSGLSYANRVSAADIVALLHAVEAQPWGSTLRGLLPIGGQGTLKHRLTDVTLHAKTGTLTHISALSGWVWLSKENDWGEFSIVSHVGKPRATAIEDAIVRVAAAYARP
jgi:D-alanyl-D-alanine carboxypeptidase/D-alanyl-D-alanine-endopeptidase (penicillin-binding protein 4)